MDGSSWSEDCYALFQTLQKPCYEIFSRFAANDVFGSVAAAAQSIAGFTANARLLDAYVHQYRLTVERVITRDIGLAARPFPQSNNIIYADNGAHMLYSGLQVQLTRRFTKGLTSPVNE